MAEIKVHEAKEKTPEDHEVDDESQKPTHD
jgi:hypothetical protein